MENDDEVINNLLLVHPSLKGRLHRQPSTGCILYIGKKIGGVEGNPLVYDKNHPGKNILLRVSVWNIYHKKPRNGKYIQMTCGNHNCHQPNHQTLSKRILIYRKRTSSNINKLRPEEVNMIRYFEYVSPIVLERIFHVPKPSIRRIQKREKRKDVDTPNNFTPTIEWKDKIEKEALNCITGLALDDRYKTQIKKDLQKSHLTIREADILWMFIEGKEIRKLEKKYTLPKQDIYFERKKALVKTWRAVGPREWIKLASKGKIEDWDLTSPRFEKQQKITK